MHKRYQVLMAIFFVVSCIITLLFNRNLIRFNADSNPLPDYGVSLMTDPGFESVNQWQNLPAGWQISPDRIHSGNSSLRYQNSDPNYYSFPQSPLPLSHGDKYKVTAWIKTENLQCAAGGDGAAFGVEWSTPEQSWAGGNYANTKIAGTQDWTSVTMESVPIPSDVNRIWFSMYVSKGCTGTAWYDDANIQFVENINYHPVITYPNYRQTFLPNQPRDFALKVEAVGNDHNALNGYSLIATINDAEGKNIWQSNQITSSSQKIYQFATNLDQSPPGKYSVETKLLDLNDQSLRQSSSTIIIPDGQQQEPRVYVDKHNRLVKDGQLFFPLGVYTSRFDTDIADKIKLINFNSVMSYGLPYNDESVIQTQLDLAASKQLNVIFSVKDNYDGTPYAITQWNSNKGVISGAYNTMKALIETFKNHSSLLAWYTNDELDTGYIDTLQNTYDYISANDYNHPTWQVLYNGQHVEDHLSNTDIMGLDVYPIWQSHNINPKFDSFGQAIKDYNKSSLGARPIWMVPEANVENKPDARPASYEEMLNYAYQGLINGARGFAYYSLEYVLANPNYETILNDMQKVGDHLNKMSAIALGLDVPKDMNILASNSKISCLTRKVDDSYYVIAANPYTEAANANFTLPSYFSGSTNILVGLPNVQTDTIAIVNDQFTDLIEPMGTRIYKINMATDKLPIISAGQNATTYPGQQINLTATVLNPGSSITNYSWSKVSGPGNVSFGTQDAKDTTIRADVAGVYTIRLTTTDSIGNVASSEMTLTINKMGDINGDQNINNDDFTLLLFNWGIPKNKMADLDGSGTADNNDFTLLLFWWGK